MQTRGLSLIEVVVAMLVLTVGLLGLAAGTAFVLRSAEVARIDTLRASAFESAIESLRSVPFNEVQADSREVGDFTVSWSELGADANSRVMQIIVTGPGRTPGGGGMQGLGMTVTDTLQYRLVRP